MSDFWQMPLYNGSIYPPYSENMVPSTLEKTLRISIACRPCPPPSPPPPLPLACTVSQHTKIFQQLRKLISLSIYGKKFLRRMFVETIESKKYHDLPHASGEWLSCASSATQSQELSIICHTNAAAVQRLPHSRKSCAPSVLRIVFVSCKRKQYWYLQTNAISNSTQIAAVSTS